MKKVICPLLVRPLLVRTTVKPTVSEILIIKILGQSAANPLFSSFIQDFDLRTLFPKTGNLQYFENYYDYGQPNII